MTICCFVRNLRKFLRMRGAELTALDEEKFPPNRFFLKSLTDFVDHWSQTAFVTLRDRRTSGIRMNQLLALCSAMFICEKFFDNLIKQDFVRYNGQHQA